MLRRTAVLFLACATLSAPHPTLSAPAEAKAPRWPERIRFSGSVSAGGRFVRALGNGLRFVVEPEGDDSAWRIAIYGRDSTQNLVGIATPPYHGPNESVIEAWHFRNADNSGPNQGEVNAPQTERGFFYLLNPADYPAYAEALDTVLHAMPPADSANAILDRTPCGEGKLVIREMQMGGLGRGSTPYFTRIRFDVELASQSSRPGR